ncbi:MAG: sporulation transcription factor Spo0A [Erysipelotrichaceae bacterium]|nr:sporulation transcription factor Spo0A [Erysipelotrichaceae bacterium]
MTKMIKTIIVDDNHMVVNNLMSHFSENSSIKVVATFNNGEEALNYLLSNSSEVDLILMDILVPGLDGIALLEELKKHEIHKKTIILSSYKDENIIRECSELNVSYYIIKPFSILSLEKRITDIFNCKISTKVEQDNIDLEISQLLHNLGIPSHIRGYKYIRDGIMIIYNNESVSLITKEIYPQIASKYATTPSRVERAIRHAIEVSWIRGDLALMEDLFGFSVSCDKAKPTNSEFLSTIADRIKMDRNIKS